jgi:hypothetical protein
MGGTRATLAYPLAYPRRSPRLLARRAALLPACPGASRRCTRLGVPRTCRYEPRISIFMVDYIKW